MVWKGGTVRNVFRGRLITLFWITWQRVVFGGQHFKIDDEPDRNSRGRV